jgi:hypothetical protein
MTATYSISNLARALVATPRIPLFYEEQQMLSPERRGLERIGSTRNKATAEECYFSETDKKQSITS